MSLTEVCKKYWNALAARGIRQVAAEINTCSGDSATTDRITNALTRVLEYQRCAVICGWPDQTLHAGDAGAGYLVIDFGTYSDGRPVSDTIDSGGSLSTIVHHPISRRLEPAGGSALSAESWPCHHRPNPTGPDDELEVAS